MPQHAVAPTSVITPRSRRSRTILAALLGGTATALAVPAMAHAATTTIYDFGPTGGAHTASDKYDSGAAWAASRGFGWIREDSASSATKVPLNVTGNGRLRSGTALLRLRSFIHMQFDGANSAASGVRTHAAWQVAVPNGTYSVTVAVGDGTFLDSSNRINVEGTPVISGFASTKAKPYGIASKSITVKDGALTFDATGGRNTKLDAISYVPTGSTPVAPPVTTPPAVTPPAVTPPVTTPPVTTPPAGGTSGGIAKGAVPATFYGANGQFVFYNSGLAARSLASMRANKIGTLRHDLAWRFTEPSPGTYRWGDIDSSMAAMAKAGIAFLPMMGQAPTWAQAYRTASNWSKPAPSRMGNWAAWAKAVAQRYGRNGAFWRANPSLPKDPVTTYEIWNEENGPWYWGTTSNAPADYADVYASARAAIKSVDPSAKVIVGGIAPTHSGIWPTQFLAGMVAHRPSLRGNVDGVGFHPYATTVPYVYALIKNFRADLDKYLGNVPMYITETGWTTAQVSPGTAQANLNKIARELPRSDCNIAHLDVHTWVAKGAGTTAKENGYALFRSDGSALPSGAGYAAGAKLMTSGAGPNGTVRICH